MRICLRDKYRTFGVLIWPWYCLGYKFILIKCRGKLIPNYGTGKIDCLFPIEGMYELNKIVVTKER